MQDFHKAKTSLRLSWKRYFWILKVKIKYFFIWTFFSEILNSSLLLRYNDRISLKITEISAYTRINSEPHQVQKLNDTTTNLKVLKFIFGVNVNNRAADGLFVYNGHRLILMYEHTKQQQSKGDAYRGIVGVVNVPSMVLEPAHNKQKFVDNTEERKLKNDMGAYMEHYLNDLKKIKKSSLNLEFWRPFGYDDMDFRFLPSDEEAKKRKRVQNTNILLQCDKLDCLKWRVLPYNRKMHSDPSFPKDDWECKDNTEVGMNK